MKPNPNSYSIYFIPFDIRLVPENLKKRFERVFILYTESKMPLGFLSLK